MVQPFYLSCSCRQTTSKIFPVFVNIKQNFQKKQELWPYQTCFRTHSLPMKRVPHPSGRAEHHVFPFSLPSPQVVHRRAPFPEAAMPTRPSPREFIPEGRFSSLRFLRKDVCARTISQGRFRGRTCALVARAKDTCDGHVRRTRAKDAGKGRAQKSHPAAQSPAGAGNASRSKP